MVILLRYIAPTLAVILLTWFGKGYISNLYAKADGYDQAKQLVETKEAEHQATIEALETDLKAVRETSQKREERREHWRQSYYKVKGEYAEYIKKWGNGVYPSELD